MTKIKRAKWIEGITQSKRILRDIAEIVTTAIKEEDGVVKEENWELVYPRPFAEELLERAALIKKDGEQRKYIPIIKREEFIILKTGESVTLKNKNIVASTIKVTSLDKLTAYKATTDYVYDNGQNTIKLAGASTIPTGSEVIVTYGTSLYRILDSMPITIEKVLKEKNPDREIPTTDYVLDYAKKTIKFNSIDLVPKDASHLSLSYVEVQGPYTRAVKDKVQLVPDLLDPDGLTFNLMTSGEIGGSELKPNVDSRVVAGGVGTGLGTGGGGTIQYTFTENGNTVTFSAGAPLLEDNQRLLFNVYYSTNPPVNDNFVNTTPFTLAKDSGDPTGKTFIIVGVTTRLNTGMPHSITIETDVTKPVLHKHLSNLNAGLEEIDENAYAVNYNNPEITVFEDIAEELLVTLTSRGEYDLKIGLNKIKDRMVLKTQTEPEQDFGDIIGDNYGAVDSLKSLEMFVEFYKPDRLVNPETGLTRYVDHLGIQHETQINNHYIQMRMFDRWNDEKQAAQDATYDKDGSLISKGAYISDWTKYAWFKDWKEYMVDELDEDPGIDNVQDGIIFKEILTTGMTEEFPIQFWISTNNNRIGLVLMGDPTLDQDNFLTSFAYLGRIHPYYSKECVVKRDDDGLVVNDDAGAPILEEKRTYFQNDVAGNFALTAGSSTLPVAIGAPPKGRPSIDTVEIAVDDKGKKVVGDLYDFTAFSYAITYLTELGESMPSALDAGRIIVSRGEVDGVSTAPTIGIALKLRFRLPEEATGYRIYRFHDVQRTAFGSDASQHTKYKLLTSVTKLDRARIIEYVDEGTVLPMHKEVAATGGGGGTTFSIINTSWDTYYSKYLSAVPSARSFEAVVRDVFTGAILDVNFSEKWGRDTATGVNDIMMYQTRSGLKYQRHNAAFISTEEFMRKEKSGQSRWTGKFHLSPIYVEHSYDKQRGWLDGIMSVEDSGIEHLDELIVDKGLPTEEVYKFFRVNAPFSMFNNSPNYSFGLAIIKSSLRWG